MYGQMTAGSWIYIGTQGILQGTYETFAELARQHFGGTLRGRVTLTAGLGGMGGAQPLAVTMNDGVCLAIEVDEARAARRARDRLRRPAHPLAGGGARVGPRPRRRTGSRSRSRWSATPRRSSPRGPRAGERFDVVTDQTSAHDALGGYVPAEIALDDATELRRTEPDDYERAVDGARWPTTSGRCSRSRRPAPSSSTTATTSGRRPRRRASRTRSTTRGSCPRSSGRSSARAAARSAGSRCRVTRRTSPAPTRDPRAVPRRRRPPALDRDGPGARPVPGPAGPHLLAGLRRARQGRPRVQPARRVGRAQRADRHRPRPPRRGLGRLPQPRDGGDGRRLRRGRRLAAAQRAREHRRRRDLGVDPPRRRRGHRLQPARRHGVPSPTARSWRRGSSSGC